MSEIEVTSYQLSFVQEEIWNALQLNPHAFYKIGEYIEIAGDLDVAAFRQAYAQARDETESMRSRIAYRDGKVHQEILPDDAPLPVVDLTGSIDARTEAQSFMFEELSRPHRILEDPLSTSFLLKLDDQLHYWGYIIHHIASDGFAGLLFRQRVTHLYTALRQGTEPQPPLGPLTHLLDAQACYRASEEFTQDRAYWRERLPAAYQAPKLSAGGGTPENTGLPLRRRSSLPADVFDRLKTSARGLRTTWGCVITAAMTAYVHRMTGSGDVVLAVPVHGRTDRTTRSAIGMASNELPLAVRVEAADSPASLVRQVTADMRSLTRHQRFPREEILRDLAMQAADFVGPSVNIMPFDRMIDLAGCTAVVRNLSNGPVDDLAVSVMPDPVSGSLELVFDANPARYDSEEVACHRDRFTDFLASFLDSLDGTVGGLPLISEAERERLLVHWNGASRPFTAQTVDHIFREQVGRTPDAVALVAGEQQLTFAELDEESDRIADLLTAAGAGPGQFVVVALPRSLSAVVALFAVVKAGAAYVPVDPAFPPERIAFMLSDTRPALIVSDTETIACIPEATRYRKLFLDSTRAPSIVGDMKRTDADKGGRLVPSDALYVVFTSGSTGKPKGVVIEHRNIAHLFHHHREQFIRPAVARSGRERFRVALTASLSVDIIWGALLWMFEGHELHIVDDATRHDAGMLTTYIETRGIDMFDTTPSLAEQLVAAGLLESRRKPAVLVLGGEAVGSRLWRLLGADPDVQAYNFYGSTECTIDTLIAQFDATPRPIVGTPIWNTRVYVLNDKRELVPSGTPGELYVAGDGVARGYLNRPELTAERFLEDAFGPPGARMYRTGDVVRWTSSGQLAFVGRADDQVQISGFRVEPGEVESVLLAYPGIAHAAVVARDDTPGICRLVAYAVPVDGYQINSPEVREWIAERLPAYMVPAAIVAIPELPLSPAGKLDRAALPIPRITGAAGSRAPRTDTERLLVTLFIDLLGLEHAGIDDSFFDLGGDSITAIQLTVRARNLGLHLTSSDVFTYKTVAELSRHACSVKVGAENTSEDIAHGVVPPTPMHRWLERFSDTADGFHQALVLRTPPGLTMATLHHVVDGLLVSHDVLRAQWTGSPGHRTLTVPLEPAFTATDLVTRLDVTDARPEELATAVRAHQESSRQLLAPRSGAMLRAVFFDAGPHRPGRLLLMVHHLAVDGVSWNILLSDIADLATAHAAGQPAEAASRTTSWRTWAQHLHSDAHSSRRLKEFDYWVGVLTGPDPLWGSRALDTKRDTVASARHQSLSLSPQTTDRLLTSIPASFRVTVEDVLLTALTLAVGAWRRERGQDDDGQVLIMLEGHGRSDVPAGLDVSRTVGWFSSLFPVRLNPLADRPDARSPLAADQALKTVKEQLRAVPDGGAGFGALRYLNDSSADRLAALGEPQICFNYLGRQNVAGQGDWTPDNDFFELTAGADADMPLAQAIEINAMVVDGSEGQHLRATWSYAASALDGDTVPTLIRLWSEAIDQIVAACGSPTGSTHTPSDFPLVRIDQGTLDRVAPPHRAVMDILPLTPLQKGLLTHALYGEPDPYVPQLALNLSGPVDAAALRTAARGLLERYPNLSAQFLPTSAEPLQIIPQQYQFSWTDIDFTTGAENPHDQQVQLHTVMREDRERPFNVRTGPLLRFTLIRLTHQHHVLVITNHHLLLDGWSTPLLLRDLFTLYSARDDVLPSAPRFADFLAWYSAVDTSDAEKEWRRYLADFDQPALVAPTACPLHTAARPQQIISDLPKATDHALRKAAHRHGFTLSAFIQAAWALVICRLTEQSDVAFGSVTAGRTPEILDAEYIVGLCIDTIPVRVSLTPGATVFDVLTRLRERQGTVSDLAPVGLPTLHQITGHRALFDTCVVVENYPFDPQKLNAAGSSVDFSVLIDHDVYHYPLSLMVVPGEATSLRLGYRPDLFTDDLAATVSQALHIILAALPQYLDEDITHIADLFTLTRHRDAHQNPVSCTFPPAAATSSSDSTPQNPSAHQQETENQIVDIYRCILGQQNITAHTDFFIAGGDSLDSMRLMEHINVQFSQSITLRTLYEHRTPRSIASVLHAASEGS
ncbi:amino acid adenylation domain-containing protein [Streptomyces sp. NPDC048297]|uniref:amino acid adenylation domain-containing protein n=1 Tax=Streptomyces sp. NPDC048297 TaxID=3365531 RepID=UPI0037152FCE